MPARGENPVCLGQPTVDQEVVRSIGPVDVLIRGPVDPLPKGRRMLRRPCDLHLQPRVIQHYALRRGQAEACHAVFAVAVKRHAEISFARSESAQILPDLVQRLSSSGGQNLALRAQHQPRRCLVDRRSPVGAESEDERRAGVEHFALSGLNQPVLIAHADGVQVEVVFVRLIGGRVIRLAGGERGPFCLVLYWTGLN